MKQICKTLLLLSLLCTKVSAQNDPYTIEVERINMPGTPSIHSFAFAESNGKWLFIGGRTNGLHGFNPSDAFPKQYSNKNIFVVDPNSVQTWSRNIFTDIPFGSADPLRSTNMQSFQEGNKLYIIGGYGYDSASNGFVTFPILTVVDVEEMIQSVVNGSSVLPHIRQLTDARLQVCGGDLQKLGDYFYLIGGHKFTGLYSQTINDQIYTDQIRQFKIDDNGTNVSITNYSAFTDTVQYHRRDMNVVNAIKEDGTTQFMILYGGVFRHGVNLPFLNPIYIDDGSITVDMNFSQKMSQYTCGFLNAYNSVNHNMYTTFFGGMSVYYYNEITHQQEYDTLVPFIDDITTLTKYADGTSDEKISTTRMPTYLGTNSQFIPEQSVPHFSNGVFKLDQISGRTFVGYIYGGIRALLPNNTPSFPSDYIMKVYITPNMININHIGSTVPPGYELSQNYPNPFNPSTKIRFSLPSPLMNGESSNINLSIYNSLGEKIETLVNSKLAPGTYEVDFDGSQHSSGIYFYKLSSGNFIDTKRMILLK